MKLPQQAVDHLAVLAAASGRRRSDLIVTAILALKVEVVAASTYQPATPARGPGRALRTGAPGPDERRRWKKLAVVTLSDGSLIVCRRETDLDAEWVHMQKWTRQKPGCSRWVAESVYEPQPMPEDLTSDEVWDRLRAKEGAVEYDKANPDHRAAFLRYEPGFRPEDYAARDAEKAKRFTEYCRGLNKAARIIPEDNAGGAQAQPDDGPAPGSRLGDFTTPIAALMEDD